MDGHAPWSPRSLVFSFSVDDSTSTSEDRCCIERIMSQTSPRVKNLVELPFMMSNKRQELYSLRDRVSRLETGVKSLEDNIQEFRLSIFSNMR